MATKKTSSTSSKRATKATAAEVVDIQLERYRSMRDFGITAEPSGATSKSRKEARLPKASRGLPFVIQKHAASHLHYDFRLGWAGVLKSWAIAKGPSYNPQDRRLAIQVEDHPMEYGGFEGIIPQGQYGGGTVMVWDQGTWWPQIGHENVDAGLRAGHLKFEMNGTKMKGKWALVRMGGHAANEAKPNWLLIKEHDPYERGPSAPPITDQAPNSAVTSRSLDQIASAEDHVWQSNRQPATQDVTVAPKSSGADSADANAIGTTEPSADTTTLNATNTAALNGLPKELQPEFISPQLAIEAVSPPATTDWLHELKLDGYRIQARKSGAHVALLTRKGLDWTHRMTRIASAVAELSARDCTLDGEVVVLGVDGNSSFADLQASFQDNETHPLTYFAFDLLHLNGRNTRRLGLRERKQLLASLLPPDSDALRISEHIEGDAQTIFHRACELHAEGIVSKRADAPSRGSRNADWLKSKCLREQEFVIAGYTLSAEGPDRIGSLLLGYYEAARSEDRKLIYAGRTGTGFTQKLKRDLLIQLAKLKSTDPAFERVPAAARRDALWVKPQLVAQVRFATWTSDNLVRQAAFLGLREDKPAAEVIREKPTVTPKPKADHASYKAAPALAAKAAPSPAARIGKASAPKSASPMRKAPPKQPVTARRPRRTSADAKRANPGTFVSPAIRLTHPEKILDPESGLTKQQLAEFYAAVAERMLPHIADRPLSLVRCPEGAGKPCFFQKHVNSILPPGIAAVDVPDKKTGVPEPYITLNSSAALISLAQLGVLEIHPWGSKNSDLEHPDRVIFDLDPDESLSWPMLTAAAGEVRQRLKKAGLESFLKLTGGKGLHIVAPIQPTLTWAELKSAAHTFVLSMERSNPSLYLTKMTKAARAGKIYLDYLRNERGATAVAPYSPRARLGAHVSLPLPWSALKEDTRPVFSVHDLDAWRSRLRTDPWKALLSTTQQLYPEKFDAL